MSRTFIALATYAQLPELAPDDRRLASALRSLGARAAAVVWDDETIEWDDFDAVVLRSCWDYHLRLDEFLDWVRAREASGVPLWNAPDAVRWNARKTYLRDLATAGIGTVPTRWIAANGEAAGEPLVRVLDAAGWTDVVVKPIVSASAYGTWRVSREAASAPANEHDARLFALVEQGGAMVQPYLPEFTRDGEWSFMFFGGIFSHAVVKRPAPGDFRVQRGFGGSARRAEPPAELARQAHAAVAASPVAPLYARVDGVVVEERLIVTELELIEPSLFLDLDPGAPDRFARAILASAGAESASS